MAEVFLALAVLVLPLAAGAAAVYLRKPWWWGAVVAIIVVLVAAIAPEPEAGEARLAAGDILFLLVIALIAAALAWLGALLVRWFGRRRSVG